MDDSWSPPLMSKKILGLMFFRFPGFGIGKVDERESIKHSEISRRMPKSHRGPLAYLFFPSACSDSLPRAYL